MGIRRDQNGIPVLSLQELEETAERFLRHVAPQCLVSPEFTPIRDVAVKLEEADYLKLDVSRDLGVTSKGHKILGCYTPKTRELWIDRTLVANDDIRFTFTLAHELGHFYLHSKVEPSAVAPMSDGVIRDSVRDIVSYRIESNNPRSLMEWQANRFAAGILVPRETLHLALRARQEQMGIVRNLGRIWVDGSRDSDRMYRSLVNALALVYQTSKAVVRIRLEELGCISRSQIGRAPTKLSELFGKALDEMFGEAASDPPSN